MLNLFNTAKTGLTEYIAQGKFIAILFVALLFLLLSGANGNAKKKLLIRYSAATTIICVIPFLAMIIMVYQTSFYEYKLVFSIVPMTIILALAMAEISEKIKGKKFILFVAGILFITALAGNFGRVSTAQKQMVIGKDKEVFQYISKMDNPVVWAPSNILEQVRMHEAKSGVLYGRNMWDASLAAYSFDTYDDSLVTLFNWIENPAFEDMSAVRVYIDTARMYGVNILILPVSTVGDSVGILEEIIGVPEELVGDYYIFNL